MHKARGGMTRIANALASKHEAPATASFWAVTLRWRHFLIFGRPHAERHRSGGPQAGWQTERERRGGLEGG